MARQVGQVLGEISENEHRAGRPMLSAIAVNEAGVPGEGFFKLARRLGKLATQDARAEEQFLNSERNAVYATWAPSAPGQGPGLTGSRPDRRLAYARSGHPSSPL
jgi:hypothetical protein